MDKANDLESVIKIHLILSAPKTNPKHRKSPKQMAQVQQTWTYEEIMNKQNHIIKNWVDPN